MKLINIDFDKITTNEIISFYSQTIKELKKRNIIRTKNITGELGGFNFQIAFSEAYVCSQQLNSN